MGESLGSILAQRNKEAKAAALAAQQEAEAEAALAAARHRANVIKIATDYLNEVKAKVTEALLAGKQIPYIYLPADYNNQIYAVFGVGGNQSIVYSDNIAHSAWADFSEWARQNEMYANWIQEPYEKTPGITASVFYQLKFTPMVKA